VSIETLPPPLFADGDFARTRKSDPRTSHIAGDVSQRSLKQTKVAVLELVLQEGELVGSEINDLYRLRASRHGWRQIAFDTPRKRAGELADDGFLEVVDERPAAGNHLPESVYAVTAKGRDALEATR
jgi:hypothetical protein